MAFRRGSSTNAYDPSMQTRNRRGPSTNAYVPSTQTGNRRNAYVPSTQTGNRRAPSTNAYVPFTQTRNRGSSNRTSNSSRQRQASARRSPVQTSQSSMFCSSGQVTVRESSVNTSTGQVVINVAVPPEERSTTEAPLTQADAQSTVDSISPYIPKPDHDIYYEQLLVKGRGSPLWIPGPNKLGPIEYRLTGVRIGDVGIIYRSGRFSFLFNVFLPAGHPIHRGGVPESFSPLNLSEVAEDIEEEDVYGPNDYLASASICRTTNVDPSGLGFETSAREGAILIMPNGSTATNLLNTRLMEEHVRKNAEHWYKYATDKRGRRVENGDIRIVVGCDKVSSWGIATLASSLEACTRLEFRGIRNSTTSHSWSCFGAANGRVGPHDEEMQGLRAEPNTAPIRNQCVFVRTMNATVSEGTWKEMAVLQIRSGNDGLPDSTPTNCNSSRGGSSGRTEQSTSPSSAASLPIRISKTDLQLPVEHPSKLLNMHLIKRHPNAKMVITQDANWISAITETDISFPEPEELCKRVLASHEICLEDDIVTLRANWLQSALNRVPSEDAGSGAECSRVQSSADNDPCPAAPSYDHKLSTSPMELQQWSGSGDPWLNTINHDDQRSKSLSKPEKQKTEDRDKLISDFMNKLEKEMSAIKQLEPHCSLAFERPAAFNQLHGHYSGPSSPAAPASFYYPSDSPALPFANCSSIPNSPFFGDFEISLPSSSANSPQFQISSPDWAHFSLSPSLVPLPPSPSTISNSPSPSNILLPLSPSSNLSSPIIPLSPPLGSQENDVFGTSYFSNELPPFPSPHPSFTASHIEPGTSAVEEVLQYGLLQTYARVPITTEHSGTGPRMLEEAAGNVHSSPSPDTSTDFSNLSVNLQGLSTFPTHRINPSSVHHLTPDFSMLLSPAVRPVPNFFVDAVGPSSYDTFSVDFNGLDQVPTITANAQNLASHRWPQRLTPDGGTGHPQQSYDVPANVSQDHIFGIKQRVLTVLKNSNAAEDAVRQVDKLDRIKQTRFYHHVFKEALDHQPKVSAASKLNAEERRKRHATFCCILCDSLFTTRNNLFNHYRSHLKIDEYICPGCNKAFRTESSSTRHKRSCRKVSDSTGIKGKRRVSHI